MPVGNQLIQINFAYLLRVFVFFQNLSRFRIFFHAEKEGKAFCLARCQSDLCGKRPASISVIIQLSPEVAACHACRISVSAIWSEKLFSVSAIGRNLSSCQSKEALNNNFIIYILSLFQTVQISVDQLPDPVPLKYRSGNKLGILQIHLILLVIAVIRKLSVAGNVQFSLSFRIIRDI